eukprot:7358123-Lingulodinium_polyedra.AAC.1
MEKLKQDPELRWAVKRLIDSKGQSTAAKCMPRGVRRVMAWNRSDGLPDYVAKELLAEMLNEPVPRVMKINNLK